jgi:hypothetical protein
MGRAGRRRAGWHEEPQLIVLRYEPPDAAGLLVAAVGKGVTSTLPLHTSTPSGRAAGSRPRQLRGEAAESRATS